MRAVTLAGLLLTFGGCLGINPGKQVATALAQENVIGWTALEFAARTSGSQEAEITMYEGELVFVVDEAGNVVLDSAGNPMVDMTTSRITAFLHVDPSADHAATSLSVAFVESTKQMAKLLDSANELVQSTIGLVAKIPPTPVAETPPVPP